MRAAPAAPPHRTRSARPTSASRRSSRSSFASARAIASRVAARPDVGNSSRARAVVHDGLVAQAVDQLAAHSRVDRRHEPEPEARQPRREHRHRNDRDAGARAARRTRASDRGRRRGRGRRSRRPRFPSTAASGAATRYAITSSIAIGCVELPHPARRDHHRQPLDERADHLERQAPRAEDDRRAQLDRRHAGLARESAPTSCRLARCGERSVAVPRPPR